MTTTTIRTEPEAAPRPATRRPARRVEPRPQPAAEPRARSPRTPFVLLVIGLLGGALVSLLLLNTVLAKDAFRVTELQKSNNQLKLQRQELQEDIAREQAPGRLDQKAQALGMRPPDKLAFVDAQTGQVSGGTLRPVPHAAAAAAAAAGVVGVPGAVVPGDGIAGWSGSGGAGGGR